MKTLHEISQLPKTQYKVIDTAKTSGYPLTWHNIITVLFDHKSIRVRRETAFKFGLCEGVQEQIKTPSKRGGARIGSGSKRLPIGHKKRPYTIYVSDLKIQELGGKEKFEKLISKVIYQKPIFIDYENLNFTISIRPKY
jgi:hypothetical protein